MIAHELAAAAFERSPSGMLVVDRAGIIIAVNREVERLFGYERDELIGQNVDMLVPSARAPSHADRRAAYMTELAARPMGAGRDLFGRHRDGRELPVEIGLGPVEINGKICVLCTVVDISARRQLENHLRQAQKLETIGNLASGLAHDFNNILQGVIGYTELARDASSARPDICADLEVVLDTARRGRDMVARVLLFSRRGEAARSKTKLEPVLNEAVHLLRATLPSNIDIRVYHDPNATDVVVDPTDLHQIIMNLANNAAQAMELTGGLIDIQTAPILVDEQMTKAYPALRPGMYACVSVIDTGSGIPKAILERIFEPFFTTKAVGKGTGLGLAMVQRIARSVGGTVEVSSREGRGTRFDVYIPHADGIDMNRPTPEATTPESRKCILYVDDEDRLAQLGRRLLESVGYQVVTHNSSLQALADVQANPARFDLVITDNKMPHLTGVELADAISKIRPDLPIMMVSGHGDSVDNKALQERGVRKLMPKPYSFSDLRAAVTELIHT
jgi:PAS domain S-box-containing protein